MRCYSSFKRIARVYHFWLYALLVLIFSAMFFIFQNRALNSFKQRQAEVIRHYDSILNLEKSRFDIPELELDAVAQQLGLNIKQKIALKSLVQKVVLSSVELADTEIEKNAIVEAKAGAMYSETRDLLEMQFAKIQHEYEALEIWCGILTVIFLVFTFYSLFKSDDLVKQGRDGLKELTLLRQSGKREVQQMIDDGNKSISEMQNRGNAKLYDIERRIDEDRQRSSKTWEEGLSLIQKKMDESNERLFHIKQEIADWQQMRDKDIMDVSQVISQYHNTVGSLNQKFETLSSQVEIIKNKVL